MGLLPDTQNCGLRMRRECRERFPRHCGLAIPACITARASRIVTIRLVMLETSPRDGYPNARVRAMCAQKLARDSMCMKYRWVFPMCGSPNKWPWGSSVTPMTNRSYECKQGTHKVVCFIYLHFVSRYLCSCGYVKVIKRPQPAAADDQEA